MTAPIWPQDGLKMSACPFKCRIFFLWFELLTSHLVFGSSHHVVEDVKGSLGVCLSNTARLLQQVWPGLRRMTHLFNAYIKKGKI